jgi:hypothetical protein
LHLDATRHKNPSNKNLHKGSIVIMRKVIRIFVLSVCLAVATNSAVSQKSEAALGAGMSLAGGSGVPLMIASAFVFGSSAVSVALSFRENCGLRCAGNYWAYAFLSGIVGFVLLDNENPQSLNFGVLSDENAGKLGLSAKDVAVYNSELEELNLVKERIAIDLAGELESDMNHLDQMALINKYTARSHEKLMEYSAQGAISAETLAVVTAIRNQ